MDLKAFGKFIETVEFDKRMASFWAPEALTIAFFEQRTDGQLAYVENCIKAFDKVYDGRGQEILTAAMVLTENCNSFKNRINGTIKDEWLSEKTFGSIAQDCVMIMNTIPQLEDWQVKLKEMFASMKWAEIPPIPEVKHEDKISNISKDHIQIIINYILQSYSIFQEGLSNMTTFTHPDVPLNELIEIYSSFKAENPALLQYIRNGVDCDGKFNLIYMLPQPEPNKENIHSTDMTKIII